LTHSVDVSQDAVKTGGGLVEIGNDPLFILGADQLIE